MKGRCEDLSSDSQSPHKTPLALQLHVTQGSCQCWVGVRACKAEAGGSRSAGCLTCTHRKLP